ncbi:MAG: hypothetical protein OXC91_11345 [Rhodobacteraceae bacterium]|nr:hypothetical protein [Paracoccaceae bacterium]
MKIAFGISLLLHGTGLFLLSDFGADSQSSQPIEDIPALDVEILTEAEYVSLVSPVPISHALASTPVDDTGTVEIIVNAGVSTPPESDVDARQLLTTHLNIPDRPELPDSLVPQLEVPAVIQLEQIPDDTEVFAFGVKSGIVEESRTVSTPDLKLGEALQLPEAPRVDLTVTPDSPPEIARDDVAREATRPDAEADADAVETVEDSRTATAPEASTPKILTEADEAGEATTPVAIQTYSQRLSMLLGEGVPLLRPDAPAPNIDLTEAIVADTIEQQITQWAALPPLGVPSQRLTENEMGRLHSQVKDEWNIGALSSEAQRVIVTVRIKFDKEGRVIDVEMIDAKGGGDDAVKNAYDVAKRAVNKAFENGVDLPVEKYEQWRVTELVFNAEVMRRL